MKVFSHPFTALEIEDIADSTLMKGDAEENKSPARGTKVMTGIPVPDLLIK